MFPAIDFLGTPIDTYALCTLLSFLVVAVAVLALRPREIPFKHVFWGMIIVFFFSCVGANLLNIIAHASEHKGRHIAEIFKASGVAYLGAPIVALFAFWIFCKIIKIPFLVFADYAVPFFMLDRIIGRLGCLGYGCCYGIPSDLPWTYAFKSWGIINIVPRHPTQAYALIFALAIFASSRYLYKKMKSIPGVFGKNYKDAPSAGIIFFYVWLCYGLLRLFNEFLRAEGFTAPLKFPTLCFLFL
jgi:phosphatidylglycerol:prolipoprotein diacylglycerol transferase